MSIGNFFNLFKNTRMNKSELAVLRISMLIAALDGNITSDELTAFRQLSESCEGYSTEEGEKALMSTLRSAGFLMLLSRFVKREFLLEVFVSEAESILPVFSNLSKQELEKAVQVWEKMANADNDFSEIERQAIDYLKKYVSIKGQVQAEALLSGGCFCTPTSFVL